MTRADWIRAMNDEELTKFIPLRKGGMDTLDNMLPTCRSCNHYKRGNTLEGWRRMLEETPETLERDCYTYRQAVRFGTVTPTPKKIAFYFEQKNVHRKGQLEEPP